MGATPAGDCSDGPSRSRLGVAQAARSRADRDTTARAIGCCWPTTTSWTSGASSESSPSARADGPSARSEKLGEALALFRGEPLSDFRYEDFAGAEAVRLEELRLAVVEEQIEADLELGRHAEVVPRLERLVADHPLRERLRAQLMLALYGAGRQADALQVFKDARTLLVDELGIDPSPALQRLERQILNHDPELAVPDGFAPARRRARVRVNLPVQPTSLIGREREIREVTDLLQRPEVRLVTLTGTGGTGKTRVAIQVAAGLLDDFADGVVFIGLAPLQDPESRPDHRRPGSRRPRDE